MKNNCLSCALLYFNGFSPFNLKNVDPNTMIGHVSHAKSYKQHKFTKNNIHEFQIP